MTLTLGFSPCPNDTFIFDALVNKKIDTEGLEINAVLEDVETLNQWALQGKLDMTKLSFPAFFQTADTYILLNAGSALGKGVGPLLVARSAASDKKLAGGEEQPDFKNIPVALPGINTTANLLFSFAYPRALNKQFMIFSAIEDAVASGRTDLGVIIHENRFTYQQKGLHKVIDLGDYWEQKMNAPIPLGGIAIKRSIEPSVRIKADRLIRKSLEFAFSRYPLVTDYVKQHSQSMSEDVMRKHIDLYVNNYSLALGDDGKKAVSMLYKTFIALNDPGAPGRNDLFL